MTVESRRILGDIFDSGLVVTVRWDGAFCTASTVLRFASGSEAEFDATASLEQTALAQLSAKVRAFLEETNGDHAGSLRAAYATRVMRPIGG